MSQVAKSASAFVRAFLAILVLELEDMVVRLVCTLNSPSFVAIVGQLARPGLMWWTAPAPGIEVP